MARFETMQMELIESGLDTSHLDFMRTKLRSLASNVKENKQVILQHLNSMGIKFKESPVK